MRQLIDRTWRPLVVWAVVACVAGCGESQPPDLPQEAVAAEKTMVRVGNPPTVFAPSWLESRAKEQLATASTFEVFHGFSFSDRIEESGVRSTHT